MRSMRVLLSCVVVFACAVLAAGQTGSIQGTVTDTTGAVVSGANITAVNSATGASRSATSSESGAFSIPALAVGEYAVTVEKTGFAPVKFNNIDVTVALTLPLNARLNLGTVAETVNVSGSPSAPIETETSQVSNLVDSEKIKALPLITRNPYELVLLSPGSSQGNAFGGFNINGSRERNNNFQLDGVDNNDTSVPGGAGGAISSNPENAEEFRVVTNNFNAEYGRNTGAIIDVVTKSGTNKLHFDAYWFGRYKNIGGARDWFNPGDGPNGRPQDPYVRNQFGYSVGGPIFKDKTFFFFNQEFQRFPTSQTASVVVPTAQFLTGKFTWHGIGHPSPTDQTNIPVSVAVDLTPGSTQNQFFAGQVFGSNASPGLDPTMQQVFALYPSATTLNSDGVSGLVFFPDASNQRSYQATTKIDHRFSDKEVLSLRYGYDPTKDPSPFFDSTLPNNVGSTRISAVGQGLSGSLTSTLSPTTINTFTVGWNHISAGFACTGLNTLNSPYPVDQFGHGSEFVMGPFTSFACARDTLLSDGQSRATSTTSFTDTYTWVKGAHTWKFGAEFRNVHEGGNSNFIQRRQIATDIGTQFGGFDVINAISTVSSDNGAAFDPTTVDFTSLSDAAGAWWGIGVGDNQSQFFNADGSRRGNDEKNYIQHEYDFYGQDSWKIRHNLTLNLGLRYQFNGVPYEEHNQLTNLYTDPTSFPVVFERAGPGTGRLLYNNDFSNLEPRVGFSWDPWSDGKTAVRASFGIFHDRNFGNLFGNARGNPPFQASYATPPFETINNALFDSGIFPLHPPDLPFDPSIPDGALQAPQIFTRNFRNPTLNSWFFGVQRELPGQVVLDVSYVGNQAHHIYRDVDPNPPQPALVAELLAFCSDPNNAFGCTTDTVSGAGNLYNGKAFGTLPENAVAFNAIGRGALSAVLVESTSNANYNALQLKVTKRLRHGLQVQGAYTWSHSIDDSNDPIVPGGAGVSFARNPLNPGQDRGNSDHDIAHVGVINYIYELPFGRGKGFANSGIIGKVLEGFQFSGVVTMQSGRAFDVIGTRDSQRVGRVGRTNLNGNPFAPSDSTFPVGTKVFFSNPGAFINPPFDTVPKLGRNHFHGPSFYNADVSLAKVTKLTERLGLETRLEVYNLANHANFRTPGEVDGQGNALFTPLFGGITSQISRADGTTGARQLQMAAKITF
jgi:outer membrane receptor protein involved in Fe transport